MGYLTKQKLVERGKRFLVMGMLAARDRREMGRVGSEKPSYTVYV